MVIKIIYQTIHRSLCTKWYNNKDRNNAILLVLPLLIFLAIFFIAPITLMLYKSVYDPSIANLLPKTSKQIQLWHYHNDYSKTPLPNDNIFKTFSLELQQLAKNKQAGKLSQTLNRIVAGSGSTIKKTSRELKNKDITNINNYQKLLISINPLFADIKFWSGIKNNASNFTIMHYANALDYSIGPDNHIQKNTPDRQIYLPTLIKTLWIAFIVTVLCVFLGYPVAYYISSLPNKKANIALLFVLLPFWSAFLVRITAWIAILQTEGVANKVLLSLNIIEQPLTLLYNKFAMIIAMVHILLPFMILPLYSVMKGINPSYLKASYSLGANGFQSFFRVYLPLSAPGLAAGCLLVFIISLGYYITPALLGGIDGQLISSLISLNMKETNNWELASALGGVLLMVVILLYIIYDKKVGLQTLKF